MNDVLGRTINEGDVVAFAKKKGGSNSISFGIVKKIGTGNPNSVFYANWEFASVRSKDTSWNPGKSTVSVLWSGSAIMIIDDATIKSTPELSREIALISRLK